MTKIADEIEYEVKEMDNMVVKRFLTETYELVFCVFFGCISLGFVYMGLTSIGEELEIDSFVYLIGAMVALLLSRNY